MDILVNILDINNKTEAVSKSYDNLVNDLRGEFTASVSTKNPALVSVRRKFVATALKHSNLRLAEYGDNLRAATDAIVQRALDTALTQEEKVTFLDRYEKRLATYLGEAVDLAVLGITNLSRKDIKFGGDQLKTIAFNVMTTMVNAGMRNAIKGAVVTSVIAGANYTGRGDKEWRSQASARTITRYHLLTVFNEVTLFAGLELGDTEFVIKTMVRSNPLRDGVITLEEYNDLKAKAFHPNANALIYRKISH